MIYLKIENGKGYFLAADNTMQEIHEIRKEDILKLLDFAMLFGLLYLQNIQHFFHLLL